MAKILKHIKFSRDYFNTEGRKVPKRKKDDKFDCFLRETVKQRDLLSRSAEKIGVMPSDAREAGPFSFEGYYFGDGEPVFTKQGLDGKIRSNKYQVTWMYFSKEYIHVYTYRFSMTDLNVTETTKEFGYEGIKNFETYSEAIHTVSKKQKLTENIQRRYFSFELPDGKFKCWSDTPIDKALTQIKKKVWEKQGLPLENKNEGGGLITANAEKPKTADAKDGIYKLTSLN